MSDTQWRRYQVFVQEAEGKPHQDYGSVHAPDPEMALLNARDVFARRPVCVSMWIVPADDIYSVTARELAGMSRADSPNPARVAENFYIFSKTRQNGMVSFSGEVTAFSAEEALLIWLSQSTGGQPGRQTALVYWIFPARVVVKSNHTDIESLYSPANEKTFRLSSDFHTLTDMRKIQRSPGQTLSGKAEE